MSSDLRSGCPIAASLDILGDRWTLVVLRDMLLGGSTRFSEFAADESIATNILTDRLHRLVDSGLVEKASATKALASASNEGASATATLLRMPVKTCPMLTSASSERRIAAMASLSSTAPSRSACSPRRPISAPPFARSGISRVASDAMASR